MNYLEPQPGGGPGEPAGSQYDRAQSAWTLYPQQVNGPESSPNASGGGLFLNWEALRRRKWLFLLCIVTGAAIGYLSILPQTPMYRARASLEIQPVNEDYLDLRHMSPTSATPPYGAESELQTQVKILQSDALIERVAGKLKIAYHPGETARTAAAGSAPAVKPNRREELFNTAVASLKVRVQPNTRLIDILVNSPDPHFAAEFANALTSVYTEQYLESRWQAIQNTSEWLRRQMGELRVKLEKSENQLQAYVQTSRLEITSEKDNVAEGKLLELQRELAQAEADRIAKQSKYELAASSAPEGLPDVLDSPTLREYHLKLSDLERQIADLSSTLTPANPKVQKLVAQAASLRNSIDKERADIISRIRNEYYTARRREALLSGSYASHSRLLSEQAGKVTQFNMLKREVDSTRLLYQAMLQRVNEASLATAMRASNIRVVDPAAPPRVPYQPNWVLNTSAGLVFGTLMGLGLVMMRERTDHNIREPGETIGYLNTIELAAIPSNGSEPGDLERLHRCIPERAAEAGVPMLSSIGDGHGQGKPYKLPLLSSSKGKRSLFAESFRAAVASILLSGRWTSRARVLAITSVSPGEGKTTVACNLGIVLAEIQRRTLLIDGDVRKPRLHQVFGVDNTTGLTDYLSSGSSAQIPARETSIPNLYVLPSGPPGRPQKLFSPRLAQLLELARQQFDMILIDTPPVLQLPDARVLGSKADAAILVVRAKQTSIEAAMLARQRFSDDGTNVLGTILNDWNPNESASPAYNNYYRNYERYYTTT